MLRIFAGTVALLLGIAVCGIMRVCTCADHGGACATDAGPVIDRVGVCAQEESHAHTAEGRQHATDFHHHDEETPQGHCGKNGCEEQCRCTATIQGFVQTPPVAIISMPVSQPVLNISLLSGAREHAFAAPPSETLRRAKPRDWVFTPVVRLGPALHSLAPPAFV